MMNFKRVILVIVLISKITTCFDLASLNHISEIVKFITEIADSVDREKIKEAEILLSEFKVAGYQNFGEVVRKYYIEQPHLNVKLAELIRLETIVTEMDTAWTEYGSKEVGTELREFVKILPAILINLYSFYVGNGKDDKGFLYRVNTDWRPYCREMNTSLQIRVLKLHQVLIIIELRGFILALKASEDPRKSAARAIFHCAQYVKASHDGIDSSLKYRNRCDPPQQTRGESYSEFHGLFQGLIVNEAQTDQINDGRCPNDCYALENARIVKCYNESVDGEVVSRCYSKHCNGKLIDCYWIGDARTCELNEGSDRRFLWAKNVAENRFYGHSFNTCNGKIVDFISSISPSGTSTCNNCMCTCAEIEGNSTAIRTLSLIPQVADISNNMVITGIRFAEKDRMLHIQIEQSRLAAFGEIIPGTEEWKKLNDFEYDPEGEGSFRMKEGDGFIKLREFVDYAFVNLEQRTFNLDEVLANEGQVVVGARFIVDAAENAFELQIMSWPVDLRTGKLAVGNQDDWINWKTAQKRSWNYNWPRFNLDIGATYEPLKAIDWNYPISWPNQRIMIRSTSYVLDMAQHTIPYLDLQAVTWPNGRVPLGGLELVYSQAKNYGGFLGFRIHGFDFSHDFKWKMPRSTFNKYRPHFEGTLVLEDLFK